ncbi:hypothetical protein [Kribbella voronezhensis]|uniref:hypothetical protein n=1 Tax=Kribbella voronezhensis TaxID=2512212 RepID=UPI0010624656|nr:hypothetical protein [Kribbella voronezhensis]
MVTADGNGKVRTETSGARWTPTDAVSPSTARWTAAGAPLVAVPKLAVPGGNANSRCEPTGAAWA